MPKTAVLVALGALLFMLASCSKSDSEGPVVLAAASMQEALEAAAADWQSSGNPRPILSFASTPAVARQIGEGAPADLVVTADRQWMDWLVERGLVDGSPRAFATNGLTVVAPRNASEPTSLVAFAADPDGGRIAMAQTDTVPAGRFARAALEHLGLWDQLEPRVISGENVRVALALVERGEVPVGIVYASDAQASQRVRVVERLDPSIHPPIIYYVAVVAGSVNEDAAVFRDFLAGDRGRAIVASHGFGWP